MMWAKSVVSGKRAGMVMVAAAIVFGGLACAATPVGIAMHVAGDAVNDVDEQQKSDQLVGKPVSAADAQLGARTDVLTDTGSSRRWVVYPAALDPLKTMNYVVEVQDEKIIALEKMQQPSDPLEYEAILAALSPVVMGKSPDACETNLKMGKPLLEVRSQATGDLIRFYDARIVKELQSPHYCVLWFDDANACEKIQLVKIYAVNSAGPI